MTDIDELELRVRVTPLEDRWLELARVYVGDSSFELTADGDTWSARVPLAEQGARQIRLTIEDEEQVFCFDQLNLMVDREAPELSLISPANSDAWVGELSGAAEARVSLEAQDLTRLDLSVTRDAQVVAAEAQVEGTAWSADLPLSEGVNVFTFTATDELMQQSTLELTLRYDPQPPGVTLTAPSSDRVTVEASTFTFSGVITEQVSLDGSGAGGPESDARVTITSRRGVDGSGEELDRQLTRSGPDGSFSATISLNTGAQRVDICGYDLADNSSCVSVIITRVEAEPCVNIASAPFSLSADYTLSGDVCPSVTTLSLSVNEGPSSDVSLNNGTFSQLITLTEAGAPQRLTLTATAPDGTSAVESVSVIWDETPPVVIISQPEAGDCFNGETVTLCGRVVDPESGTRAVRALGQVIDLSDQVAEGEAWWEGFCVEVDADDIDDDIDLRGENGAGAQGQTAVEVTVDRIAPSVELPPANTWFRADERGVIEIPGQLRISGCGLVAQGFNIYRLYEEGGELVRGRALSPQLSPESAFIYREEYPEGSQSLEVVLRDRATNERVTRYDFQVDGTAPLLDLTSHPFNTISADDEPTLIFEAFDAGSGLDLTTGQVSALGPQGEVVTSALAVSPVEGAEGLFTLSATLTLTPGTHNISASVSDSVGNVSVLDFTYTVDQDPPVAHVLSHLPGDAVADGEVVILEVSDALSRVSRVEVNGVLAETFGTLWIALGVPLTDEVQTLSVTAEDEAGNIAESGVSAPEVAVSLRPYVWRAPSQLGAPHPGFTLSDGAQSLDTGRDLSGLSRLWWASSEDGVGELSGLLNVEGQPVIESGVSDQGGFSLSRFGARLSARGQRRLPASDTLMQSERVSVNGALTLFTLEELQGASGGEGALRLWQLAREVGADVEVIGEPALDDDEWVEVRLGLPEQLSMKTFAVGDVSGDGRADLIGVSASGAFLFTLGEDGSFRFEGAAGLAQRGLGALDHTVSRLWWVELDDAPESDTPPDLVAQRADGVSAWLSALSGGAYQYTEQVNFPDIAPQRVIDGWVHLDWDGDGALDALAWSSGDGVSASLVRRYTLTGQAWGVTPITAQEFELPSPMVSVQWADLDLDETLEVLCVGVDEIEVLESQGGTLNLDPQSAWYQPPQRSGVSASYEVALPADVDLDGDEDWLFGLTLPIPPHAEGEVEATRGELWGIMSTPAQLVTDYAPIRVRIRRGDAAGLDALGATIRINQDGDLLFERAYPARPFSETLINTRGAGSVDLQVVFPDWGATGGNVITLFEVARGATVTVVDDQE